MSVFFVVIKVFEYLLKLFEKGCEKVVLLSVQNEVL